MSRCRTVKGPCPTWPFSGTVDHLSGHMVRKHYLNWGKKTHLAWMKTKKWILVNCFFLERLKKTLSVVWPTLLNLDTESLFIFFLFFTSRIVVDCKQTGPHVRPPQMFNRRLKDYHWVVRHVSTCGLFVLTNRDLCNHLKCFGFSVFSSLFFFFVCSYLQQKGHLLSAPEGSVADCN